MLKDKILIIGLCFLTLSFLYGAKPLGERFKLIANDEVVIIDNEGNGYFDIYEPEANAYQTSFALPGVPFDVASADLNNSGKDEIIGVYNNSVYINWHNGTSWQGQSFTLDRSGMKYVAAGDYFDDSIHAGCEVITASQDSIFWWKWTGSSMIRLKTKYISGGVYDICCGDIDKDKYDEVVYLTSAKEGLIMVLIDENGATKSSVAFINPLEEGSYVALSAGNLKEDIQEELVILETCGWPWTDKLHIYDYDLEDSVFVEIKVLDITHRGDIDVACGNKDTDRYEEILVLRDDRKIDVFNYDGIEGTFNLGGTTNPRKISAPDWDGDNAQVIFTGGPYLCSSELWPSLVISLPPYHNGIIDGECTIRYGEEYQQNQNLNATIALTAQTTMGYGIKFPGSLFEANISMSIEMGVKRNLKQSRIFTWGSWYEISSNYPHNIVMATRTYYDGFFYKIFDPRNLLGDTLHQDTINLAVPKASGNMPMTVENYLIYADTIEYLPKGLLLPIQQPGDITTYPRGYVYPNGYPIPSEELLFVNHPIYSITQGVQGGWYIYLAQTQIHEDVLYSKGNLAGKLSGQIPGGPAFSFQVASAIGAEMTHQFKVGRELLIEATMGYLPDTLNFWQFYYEYSPYIYRARSDSGGFYVLNFMVQNLGWGYGVEEIVKSNSEMQNPSLSVFPNPFQNYCVIKFQIPSTKSQTNLQTDVGQGFSLAIYDVTGRVIKDFSRLTVNGEQSTVVWNGVDDFGRKVPAGIYFVRFEDKNFEKTEKVILMR
ncbi:MAG: T9SS type A sorting domain-containing protein [candidate division WOR-3 bacterium]